jgi:hypothetical protein
MAGRMALRPEWRESSPSAIPVQTGSQPASGPLQFSVGQGMPALQRVVPLLPSPRLSRPLGGLPFHERQQRNVIQPLIFYSYEFWCSYLDYHDLRQEDHLGF